MAEISVKQQIHAPIDKVFAIFSDFPSMVQYIPDIEKVEMLTDGPIRRGTQIRETRNIHGKKSIVDMVITLFRHNESIILESKSHGMRYITTFRFTKLDKTTLVEIIFESIAVRFPARILSWIFIFMKGSIRYTLEKDLDDIKKVCEQR